MQSHIKAVISLLLITFTITGLSGIGQAMQINDASSSDVTAFRGPQKVVFLEHNMVANGTVVKGSVPFRSVNFPSYWFNANTGELNGEINFPINNSLKLIFGDSLTLSGNFGSGTGNKLYGAYTLPMRANQATIYSVDLAGDISLYVNGRMTVLKPGGTYAYQENETLADGKGVVNVLYNHTYINHGLINKNDIRVGMISTPET